MAVPNTKVARALAWTVFGLAAPIASERIKG
jgi:hypothetical protein